MKKTLLFLITLTLIYAGQTGFAQTKDSINPIEVELADEAAIVIGGQKVTLAQAIKIAIDQNRDILMGKYDVAMTDSDAERYKTKYSPYLNAEAGLGSYKYPEMSHSTTGESKKSVDVSASIAKMFSSGTTVSAGVQKTYDRTKWGAPYNTIMPEKTYNPVIFATVQQELLKNGFGYTDRKEQQLLENAALMQRDAIIYNLSLVVVGVIVDYWDVIVNKNQMDNARLMLRETRKVRNIISGNVRLGLAERFELNLWNSLVASSEAMVANSEQDYRDSLRNFLRLVNLDENITMQEKAILSAVVPEINEEEALKTAYEKRVDYKNALRAMENSRLELDIAENNALPSLTGEITVSSMDYNTEMGESYSNAASGENPSIEGRIKMTWPLDNRDQKISRRNARWSLEQSKHEVDKYRRLVKDDIASKIEKIKTNYNLYQKAKEARVEAETYYRSMLVSLRRGRFTAAAARDALDSLISSREQELSMLVHYNASLLDFEVAKNELFETYDIDVESYIPKN
jgi:outer membrane protein TolC